MLCFLQCTPASFLSFQLKLREKPTCIKKLKFTRIFFQAIWLFFTSKKIVVTYKCYVYIASWWYLSSSASSSSIVGTFFSTPEKVGSLLPLPLPRPLNLLDRKRRPPVPPLSIKSVKTSPIMLYHSDYEPHLAAFWK